jgi:hypothetical protein
MDNFISFSLPWVIFFIFRKAITSGGITRKQKLKHKTNTKPINKYTKLFTTNKTIPNKYKHIFTNQKSKATYHTGKQGKVFTLSQKKDIYKRDKGKCRISGKRLRFSKRIQGHQWMQTFTPARWAEPDHVIPKSIGGPNTLWNGMNLWSTINRKKSGYITREVLDLCRKRRETIYLTKSEFDRLVRVDLLRRF